MNRLNHRRIQEQKFKPTKVGVLPKQTQSSALFQYLNSFLIEFNNNVEAGQSISRIEQELMHKLYHNLYVTVLSNTFTQKGEMILVWLSKMLGDNHRISFQDVLNNAIVSQRVKVDQVPQEKEPQRPISRSPTSQSNTYRSVKFIQGKNQHKATNQLISNSKNQITVYSVPDQQFRPDKKQFQRLFRTKISMPPRPKSRIFPNHQLTTSDPIDFQSIKKRFDGVPTQIFKALSHNRSVLYRKTKLSQVRSLIESTEKKKKVKKPSSKKRLRKK